MSGRIAGRVVTPDGVVAGEVVVTGERIVAVRARADVPDRWVAPGFVELQVNGGHGIDVTTQPERIPELAARLPEQGVTAFLPTVVTCPPDVRDRAIATFAALPTGAPGAIPLGLHLEGPMLSPTRRGAHREPFLRPPSPDVIAGWSRQAGIALVTLAPELPGALDVIATLRDRGVSVALGHTDATAAELLAGRGAGATYATHLYNAMRPFGHRDPGPIGAILADGALVAGLICDGLHVDPVAVRMAWHALGPQRTSLVTDAVAPLGVTDHPDGVRTPDGVLAGSVLRLDEAVRNLVAWTGCAVPDALATVTSTPADVLGLTDRGRIVPGARADLTVLDPELRVVATYVGGSLRFGPDPGCTSNRDPDRNG